MANLADDWLGATADYFVLTGEKSPKVPKIAKFFSSNHKEVSARIQKLVDIKDASLDADVKAKAFKKALTEFQADSSSYVKTLQGLIDDEKKESFKVINDKNEVEKVTTARRKGLKMLKTRLEDYDATFEQQSGQFEAVAKQMSSIERVESQISIGLKKGFKRAAAASAAIKAKPTVSTWNAELVDGVRSLTTALGAYKTLKKMYETKGLVVPNKWLMEIAGADDWIKTLTPWASGDKMTLAEGHDVLNELKLMMVQVKACLAVYKDRVT